MSNKLEKFNETYNEFLNNVLTTFSVQLTELQDKPTMSKLDNLDTLVYFIKNHLSIFDKIINRDDTLFNNDLFLLPNINFKLLWTDSTDITKIAIWEYCYLLYTYGTRVTEYNEFLTKHITDEGLQIDLITKHDDYMSTIISFLRDNNRNKQAQQTEQKEQSEQPNIPGLPGGIMNTMIGTLATELASEIDISNLQNISNPSDILAQLMGGGDNGLGNIINKVSSKLNEKVQSGQLDEKQLLNEAQQMMGDLQGNPMNLFSGMDPNMANMAKNMANMMGGQQPDNSQQKARTVRRRMARIKKKKIKQNK
jgi:hypothetical protein